MLKTCQQCSITFNGQRSTTKFCSRECVFASRRVEGAKWRDKEQIKIYMREYVQKNRDAHNERSKSWVARNEEKRRISALNYAHRNREKNQAREIAYAFSDVSNEDLVKVYAKAKSKCVYCGKYTRIFTIDHVHPIHLGGAHEVSNLIPCCKSCNSSKGTKDVADWLHQKHGVLGLARAYVFLTKGKIENVLYE